LDVSSNHLCPLCLVALDASIPPAPAAAAAVPSPLEELRLTLLYYSTFAADDFLFNSTFSSGMASSSVPRL